MDKKEKINMSQEKYFIRTDDPEVAEELRACGCTELSEPNCSTFCFMNNGNKSRFNFGERKLVFTNVLCL